MIRYRWAAWGDLNAFFGLMLDNVAVLVLLVATLTAAPNQFTPQFVLECMVPGTALGVLVGDLIYTWLAFRLARRCGKSDVTAMPLGLDTPSTFVVGQLVLLPALENALKEQGADHDTAMVFAWHVGAMVLLLIGLFKTICAPFGNVVRAWVPRAGLLGSLAAVALALIAFMPLLDVGAAPPVGMLALVVILVTLVARRSLPGHVPGALAAVAVGVLIHFAGQALGEAQGWPLVPSEHLNLNLTGSSTPLPGHVWQWDWWERVVIAGLEKLPIMLPFALATIVGGIDCTESAAAAGDEYDTRSILLTEGLASVLAGLAGGVIQNTPYIGQPAYKAMGGRAGYTLATALFIGAAGFFGWFTHIFEFLPRAALFPILIYVGLEITAQSFHATPSKHYPALALAALPALAYLITIPVGAALAGRAPAPPGQAMVQTIYGLANGFIVTSLLWGALLAAVIDGASIRAAIYLLIAAACSLAGIIHSPFVPGEIAWPWEVLAKLPEAARYQSPYHWAAAYVLAALLVLILMRSGTKPVEATETEGRPSTAE
ncbi:MAG: hypothetical protein K2R98_25850 [Gemmataceae bacterium]|nr:hypothetical protein [Gemmataceae bacterium]